MNYAQNAASGSFIQDGQEHFVFGYAKTWTKVNTLSSDLA
jgi:hypothetical protein